MINQVKEWASLLVLPVQAGSLIGIPTLYLGGRVLSKIDPVKGAQFFSGTAALGMLVACILGYVAEAALEAENKDRLITKTEKVEAEGQKMAKVFASMFVGDILTAIASNIYYKEFSFPLTIAATFTGALGSITTNVLIDKIPDCYGPIYIIQSGLTAGFVGLYSAGLFSGVGASAVAAFAAKTAGFSMAIGLGAGFLYGFLDKRILPEKFGLRAGFLYDFLDKRILPEVSLEEHDEELKLEKHHERFCVILLSGAATSIASGLYHKFSVPAAVAYALIGVAGSWGSYKILGSEDECDKL